MTDAGMEISPTPTPSYKKWFFVLLGVFMLVVAGGIYFYVLIQDNVTDLQNGNVDRAAYLDTADDPVEGNPDATIVIVEFSDFQCPFCFQAFPIVRELINAYGQDVKFVYRDFPITDSHPQAQKAAEAGECAHVQGRFWEMHDKLFLNQNDLSVPSLKRYANEIGLDTELFNQCLDSNAYADEVEEDFVAGLAAGVTGTPTFFINGRPFTGSVTFDQFAEIIDQLKAIQ
ncbi:MAG: DsbA family protein [Candidatus Kerfeldbacteria bacterium]|nr:DsbA family protein [Candidatus Kerfeldbacteria bacterium]